MCSTGIGHNGNPACMAQFVTQEHDGHKADSESWKRARKPYLRRKIIAQLISVKENREYYQSGTEWHSYSTEAEISKRRKL